MVPTVNRRVLVVVIGAACVAVLLLVAAGVQIFYLVVSAMDRTPSHVCGLAYVRRSPAAVALLGTPIAQKGITAGRTSRNGQELSERITFTAAGPRGEAFVLAEGSRSPLGSQLTVTIGRDLRSRIVYSGPLDCPELHDRP